MSVTNTARFSFIMHVLFGFQAQTLAKIHHKNLVSLFGYCKERENMALVYEYMSEGSLDKHLRGMQILK